MLDTILSTTRLAERCWGGPGLYEVEFSEMTEDGILRIVYEAKSLAHLVSLLDSWEGKASIADVFHGVRPEWL